MISPEPHYLVYRVQPVRAPVKRVVNYICALNQFKASCNYNMLLTHFKVIVITACSISKYLNMLQMQYYYLYSLILFMPALLISIACMILPEPHYLVYRVQPVRAPVKRVVN